MNKTLALILLAAVWHAGAAEPPRQLVAVGRVEAVDGEIEVSAQLSGTLTALHVKEGDEVKAGAVLAEVDAAREQAALDLALANLARVKAGNGKEEIATAQAERDAIAEELLLADLDHDRALQLRSREAKAIADELLDQRQHHAAILRKRLIAAAMRHAAMQRGPLQEQIAVAEAAAQAARTAYDLRLVKAASAGQILLLHKHVGDVVSVNFPSPILRMADTDKLRVRVEISEQDVAHAREGMQGLFTVHGAAHPGGKVQIQRLLPAFAPRRLFEPDSTARMDTRTLQALCDIVSHDALLYLGQRVLVRFEMRE